MKQMRRFARIVCTIITLSMLWISVPVQPLCAAMIGTETVLEMEQTRNARQQLNNFLNREDVQAAITAQGIDPREARARIDCLSDAEVMRLAAEIDRLPAGGNGVGAFIGALLIIFLVLLFTDIMGWTDVYPFVKHHAR